MKRKKINLDEERKIIIYMITSDEYLKAIINLIRPSHFKSSYARIVSGWITEYWKQYEKNPGKDIQDIYKIKKKTIMDEEESDSVSEFLLRISKEYQDFKPPNVKFQIDAGIKYLKIRSLESLREKLDEAITEADPLKGEHSISNYKRVENSTGKGISILRDSNKVTAAFMDEDEYMFSFPGALGDVCGPFLRGDFAAFLGSMGRGKSWWLWYSGQVALYYGLRIVFFTFEMTENQVLRRGWQSLVASPKKTKELQIPYFEELETEDEEDFKWKICMRKEKRQAVDTSVISGKQKAFRRQFRTGDIRIIPLPSDSATVLNIEAELDNFAYYDNFVPDVIILDYADLISPGVGVSKEHRHQLDSVWKRLRGMAQSRKALVISASQTGRKGLGRDSGGEDVAEDIRKLAHVAKMVVLNQSEEDYKRDIMRISQIKERDGKRSWREAVVLQCLDIGRPHLDSRFKDEVNYDEFEEKIDKRTRKKHKKD